MTKTLKVGLALVVISGTVAAQGGQYPVARTVDQGDTYSRCGLPDPYRWLEDDPSAKRLNALCDYAKFPSPSRKGDYNGLQNQSVLYIQKG